MTNESDPSILAAERLPRFVPWALVPFMLLIAFMIPTVVRSLVSDSPDGWTARIRPALALGIMLMLELLFAGTFGAERSLQLDRERNALILRSRFLFVSKLEIPLATAAAVRIRHGGTPTGRTATVYIIDDKDQPTSVWRDSSRANAEVVARAIADATGKRIVDDDH